MPACVTCSAPFATWQGVNAHQQRHRNDEAKGVVAEVLEELAEVLPELAPEDAGESEASASDKMLRIALERSQRALHDEKTRKAAYAARLYDAVRDAFLSIEIPPVIPPKLEKTGKATQVAVPLVSDLQLHKVTPDYNSEICAERMDLYADKIIRLTELQREYADVTKVVVCCLGDIIEGVDIFPGQAYLIDAGLYRQVLVTGVQIMMNFFRRLLACFETVEVVWVIGNHGRIGRKGQFDPEDNGDRMLGKTLQMLFEMQGEKRITFDVPDGRGERHWYAIAEIGNYRAMCIHGDQIKGSMGFPWYGLGKKVPNWADPDVIPCCDQRPECGHRRAFNDVFMGHYHQAAKIPLNKRNVWANGSTESYNTFAQETLAAMSDPSQWLLFVDPERGRVTAPYEVHLSK